MEKFIMEIEVRETYTKEIVADSLEEAKSKATRVLEQTNTYHTPQLDLVEENPTYDHMSEDVNLISVVNDVTKEKVTIKEANNPIDKIDWELLSKQKEIIINDVGGDMDGILSLLDSIQDYAVDTLGIKEEIVFPNLEKG